MLTAPMERYPRLTWPKIYVHTHKHTHATHPYTLTSIETYPHIKQNRKNYYPIYYVVLMYFGVFMGWYMCMCGGHRQTVRVSLNHSVLTSWESVSHWTLNSFIGFFWLGWLASPRDLPLILGGHVSAAVPSLISRLCRFELSTQLLHVLFSLYLLVFEMMLLINFNFMSFWSWIILDKQFKLKAVLLYCLSGLGEVVF